MIGNNIYYKTTVIVIYIQWGGSLKRNREKAESHFQNKVGSFELLWCSPVLPRCAVVSGPFTCPAHPNGFPAKFSEQSAIPSYKKAHIFS